MGRNGKRGQPAAHGRSAGLRRLIGIARAIRARALVCAIVGSARVRFYPYAAGWRSQEPFVLGLVSGEAGWAWQWIPLAEIEFFFLREGDWVAIPPAHRPPLEFLTHLFCAAE